jgi:hypothetical protein
MFDQKYLESLRKSLFQLSKMTETMYQQSSQLASIGKQLSNLVTAANRINFSIQLPEIYSSLQIIDTSQWLKTIKISTEIFDTLKTVKTWNIAYSSQIRTMTENLSLVAKRITADFAAMKISAFDFSSLGIFEELNKLLEYSKDAVDSFNSAGWTIAPSMNYELREKVVLYHQQNKTRYVSRVILGYYHKDDFSKLKNTVEAWEKNLYFAPRMRIFRAALKAHCEGNYTLSVPTLLPQIEGILNEYVKANNLDARLGKVKEVYSAVINDLDEYPLSSWTIANTLLFQLQTNTYTYTDFEVEFNKSSNSRRTTRHTILHGIATDYDKPIYSLKLFVLLDALSILQEPDK